MRSNDSFWTGMFSSGEVRRRVVITLLLVGLSRVSADALLNLEALAKLDEYGSQR